MVYGYNGVYVVLIDKRVYVGITWGYMVAGVLFDIIHIIRQFIGLSIRMVNVNEINHVGGGGSGYDLC